MHSWFVGVIGSTASSLGRRIRFDTKGVAAVEFGFVAWIMAVMFIGTIELGMAISLDRRVSQATSSVADLIARDEAATTLSVSGTMEIAKHILRPYDDTKLKISLIIARADMVEPGKGKVLWSYSHNGAGAPNACADYSLPVGIVSPGNVVVITESQYDYEPFVFKRYLSSNVILEERAMLTPRLGTVIFNGVTVPC